MINTKVTLDSQQPLLKGAKLMADTVGATLGPKGRTVILEPNYGDPFPTKDGVTVASQVSSEDPIENTAIRLIRQAASKTASSQGDGTTTTTLLTYSFFREGSKLLSVGYSFPEIKKRFEMLNNNLIEQIEKFSKKATKNEELRHIVSVSSSFDDEITSLIMEAIEKVGSDAVITLADGKTSPSSVEVHPGYVIDRSYVSPYFADSQGKASLDNPLILVTDLKISSAPDAVHLMQLAFERSRPLVIIADDIEGPALATLIVNHLHKKLPIFALRAPSYGENRQQLLEDIAAATSATLISSSRGQTIQDVKHEHFGQAEKLIADKNHTTLVKPRYSSKVNERIESLKSQLETLEPSSFFHTQLLTRIGRLSSKMATIHVFAISESALKEKKARFEDALRALTSALQSGYVAGAFSSIIHALPGSKDPIALAYKEAILYPFRVLCQNASQNADLFLDKLSSLAYPMGVDLNTNEITDLDKRGVIDPTGVITSSLTNALETALLLISSSAVINQTKPSYTPYEPINGQPAYPDQI